ncbi:hypothetical protein TVAG_187680 [Trichomonas vaginalis G3]|uniref:Uncharacterized protein n=1 Tax=Trichomonas vaginalis (strain ATCC PRA-98 / G3) TaxID=412133 RepID=A2DUZ0_TRIV3|nr:hypothetical protein TVAGG3_0939870 [Trichomonas vaginalis G3]EAY15717.1 hypothetical protein TVAG_187680 [Trichomonas vaginalis G3]KAI5486464.1 hypothetical protein TVAGG3_0939870 [Trichomonas vaginalis G3]|eukprot:XP_001327940.1 hypothetical protein [Trichomonas vaginalis G3]
MESTQNSPTHTTEPKQKMYCVNALQIAALLYAVIVILVVVSKTFVHKIFDSHETINGMMHTYPNGTIFFYAPTVTFNNNNYFGSIYVKGVGSMASADDKISIFASLTCQGKSIPKTISDTFLTTPSGEAELYTSWYPIYDNILVELNINGAPKDIKPYLFVVKSTEESAHIMNSINGIIRYTILGFLCFYIFVWIFYSNKEFDFLKVLSVIILTVTYIANLHYNHTGEEDELSIIKHAIFLMVRGVHGAINLVSIFCISMYFFSREGLGTALLIAALYVLTEAMTAITTDSFIVSYFFDNNGIVWVFFFSTSIISKVSFFILACHHLIMIAVQTTIKRKRLYMYFYSILLLLLIIPQLARASLIIYEGYQSSLMNFICEYVAQYIFVLFFCLVSWPSYEKPFKSEISSELTDLDHERFMLEHDVSVQFEHPGE